MPSDFKFKCPSCGKHKTIMFIPSLSQTRLHYSVYLCWNCRIFLRVLDQRNSTDGRNYLYEREIQGDILSEREKLIIQLGGKCITQNCPITDSDLLDLHHINNDGKIDRQRLGGDIYGYYLRHLDHARERLKVVCVKHHRGKNNG